jgi:phytoene dehydrogenase-like protein
MRSFDAIVIGGGHNGLVAAGYLARAGLKTLVLERRPLLGGACVTEEPWPGYKVSSLAYLCSLFQPKIIRDLELERFGYRIFPKDPAFFTPLDDGRHLFFWQDEARTVAEIAKFSAKDAAAFPTYEAQLARLADLIEATLLETPPNLPFRRPRDVWALIRLGFSIWKAGGADMTAFCKIMTQSVQDFLAERFESDVIRATLATDGIIGACGSAATPGTAYTLLHHCMGSATGKRGLWGFVRGGMGGISGALSRSAEARGAEMRVDAPVCRILVQDGRAHGVALADGTEFQARCVLSNVDPHRTFLDLVDPGDLDPEFQASVRRIRMDGYVFKVNLALDGLPDFTAFPGASLGLPHRTTMHICPSMDYIERAWDDARPGIPSRDPILEMTIPTAYDDSIAPPGKHLMNIFVQYAPYRLHEGTWDDLKETFADRCLDVLAEYAPNIKRIIRNRQALSPLDLEREYGLTGGNIFHGELALDQMFFMRPLAGWAQYRTPIPGLYLCGSGAHPGGGVIGAPGYNAAKEVLADLRRDPAS